MTDIYDDLKKSTPEERILIYISYLKSLLSENKERQDIIDGLSIAFKLIGDDGWKEIAPLWYEKFYNEIKHIKK